MTTGDQTCFLNTVAKLPVHVKVNAPQILSVTSHLITVFLSL